MSDAPRWPTLLLVFVLALCFVGLIAYARGPEHHRGDDLGSHGTKIVVIQPSG